MNLATKINLMAGINTPIYTKIKPAYHV